MGCCVQKKYKTESDQVIHKSVTSMLMTSEQAQKLKLSHQDVKSTSTPSYMLKMPTSGKTQQGSLIFLNKKILFEGIHTKKKQQGFEDKRMSVSDEQVGSEILFQCGLSVTCKKGLKSDAPNQDDYFIVLDGKSVLLGVFDGHGPFGHDVSNYVHKYLPSLITSHSSLDQDPELVFKESFVSCNDSLLQEPGDPSRLYDCSISGSTATLAYIVENRLYVGYVGDSRAVIGRLENNNIVARDLTIDHRPNLPSEMQRILSCGGEVRQLSETTPYRIFMPGQDYPGLSMSRSFGDIISRNLGVISDPETLHIDLEPSDVFLLICTDGVWEFITSQEAVSLVYKCNGDAKKASEKLSALAWMRWKQKFSYTVDDITIIVMYLNYKL
jgi:serine/threonine protein phosphatase PrpC